MKLQSLALAALLTPLLAFAQSTLNPFPPTSPDPVIGEWIWMGNGHVSVQADGQAHNKKGGDKATWKFLQNKELERKYEFFWSSRGRIFVDRLTLSRDGKKLEGKNQQGNRVWGEKIPHASPSPK